MVTSKRKKQYFILFLIALVAALTIGLLLFLLKPAEVNIPKEFTSVFTTQNGYEMNYDPLIWDFKIDKTLGATLNNKKNLESIVLTVSQIDQVLSEDVLIDNLIKPLQKDNISIEKSKEIINGITFNKVVVTDKGDDNIIKNDENISFLKLEGNVFTSITILNVKDSAEDAVAIINTIRK